MTRYKCVQCDYTLNIIFNKDGELNKRAKDHMFYIEHAGFIRV
jgi:hypothetical protein